MSVLNQTAHVTASLAVWTYWICVCVLVIRSHIRYRTSAGGLPRTGRERWMWMLWVPAILLWQVLPMMGMTADHLLLRTPEFASSNPLLLTFRLAAAVTAVTAFALTVPCWLGMGRNWSMAIVPGKKCRLITDGMFARVRHPIYSLSILLMASTMIVTLSPAMLLVGVMHITMLTMKTISEERYLVQVHGDDYLQYCRQTGRFLPRLFSPPAGEGDEATRQAA
jgi:protein-S-isoprenylcysteine O-methyltransferase Ste14